MVQDMELPVIFKNLLGIALRSILKNKLRSMLTSLGIIIGVSGVIVMSAVGEGTQALIRQEINLLGTNVLIVSPGSSRAGGVQRGTGSLNRFTLDDVEQIRHSATLLRAISPLVMAGGQVIAGNANWATEICGVSTDYFAIKNWKAEQGSLFTEKDVSASRKVALLGRSVADELFAGGNPVGQKIRIRSIPFTVIGVLEEKGQGGRGLDQDDLVIAPATTVLYRLKGGRFIDLITASAVSADALEAAEEVGGGGDVDPFDVLDLLARLVDKSLVQAEPSGGDGRYRFLESVRQFLHARLLASGEADAVRKRHLAHYLGLAERLAPRLALGDGPACLARLEAEHHNLDGALEWALATKGSEALLRLVTALSLFYELRGHLAHGGRWFDRALGAASDAPPALRARSLWGAAHVAFYGGDYEKAAARAAEARDLAEAAGDRWAFARALNTLGVMQALEDPEEARVSLARSIELGRSIDDAWAVADGWKMTTVAWYVQHDDAGARGAMEELRRLGESLGSRFFLAWHHALEGFFARARGEYAVARAAFESSLEDCRFVGDPSTGGFAEVWSAALEADEGRPERAAQRLEKLLETAAATGSELAVPEAVAALVAVTLGQGDSSRALGRASKHLEATRGAGVPLWTAQVLVERAAAQRETGDLPGAASALDEATRLVARLANVPFEARIDFEKGLLARAEGDDARAGELLEHARERQARLGLRPALVRTLEAQAALAADTDRPERASGLLADADALRAAVGLARRPADGTSRPRP